MKVHLAYGKEGLDVNLPDDAPVTVIEPLFVPGLPDETAAIIDALRDPTGRPPLSSLVKLSDTIAIVFSDLTRPTPNDRILPPLLNELAEAGISPDRITLINSLGTHRPQTEEELEQMLGPYVARSYRIVQHDAWDDENLVEVARNRAGSPVKVNRAYMDASVRILTGFIEPHFFAGFSGGPKAVLPGIASVDAIMDNHGPEMIAHPKSTWATTDGNPIWEEMVEVVQATAPSFLLNVTLNSKKEITGVFAGEMVPAHRAGTTFVREKAMRAVSRPYDLVITSNSGYPLDLNLYQAVKGMSAAAQIVREGGDIVIAAECWDGIPAHGKYGELLRSAPTPEALLDRIMEPGFRMQDSWQAQIHAQIRQKARVHVYAGGLSDAELRAAHVEPCHSIEETVARIRAENPDATIAVLPEGPQTVPYVG